MAHDTRLVLDVHALQVEGYADRGIGRYVAAHAEALARRGAVAGALLAPGLPPPSGLPSELLAEGCVAWDSLDTCRTLVGAGPVAYHVMAPFLHVSPSDPAGLGPPEHWDRAGVPRVVTVYDLIPLRASRYYLPSADAEASYRRRAAWVAGADLVLTDSEHARSEVLGLLQRDPSTVVSIGAGVSSYFSPPDGTDEALWQFHFGHRLARPYILTVGGSDVRKGTDRMIAALGLMAARGCDVPLLVIGDLSEPWLRTLSESARACGVAGRVVFAGAVDDELLRACYRRAEVTVMPSLAEGAGLPVLESAACGAAALASGTGALAETAAVAEALFDPNDIDSIAVAVTAALEDPARRARILSVQRGRAARATWDDVAARTVDALERIGDRAHSSKVALVERRLAVVGQSPGTRPSPPSPDPDGSRVMELPGEPPVRAVVLDEPRSIRSLGTTTSPAGLDSVVYVLGGERLDREVLRAARRHAGWLWLVGPVGRSILEPLVRRSRGILVSSDHDRRATLTQLDGLSAPVPVIVVPELAASGIPMETWLPALASNVLELH